jgi:zinc protease
MKSLRLMALAALALMPAIATAQRVAPPLKYETFTLPNGLKFIVHEDHSTPIVAVDIWYDVGSANEAVGRSGFAHFFEHMLFEETENLKKGDYNALLEAAGSSVNATTNQDRTFYYEVVPSNRINLALWLEAERMARLRVSADNFAREREAVKEERRLRVDNAPYVNGFLTMDTLVFDYRPYRHTVIGTMDDLNAAKPEDVMSFYRQFYVPNNATVTLAGDITLEQARKYANEYFAAIPKGPPVTALPAAPVTPRTDGERRVKVEDKLASVPIVFIGYTLPPHSENETYALTMLGSLLGRGESSRLNQAIVKEAKAANFAAAGLDSRSKGGYMFVQAQPTQGNDVAKIEELVYAQIEKVKAEGVSAQELEKVRRQVVAAQVMGRQTVLSKAEALQHARFMHNDLETVNTDIEKFNTVTADDIRRVAQKYLTPANRTVVTVVPATKAATSD